jgi:hypothetical protein
MDGAEKEGEMRGFPILPALAAVLIAGCGRQAADQEGNEGSAPAPAPVAEGAP